MAWFGGTVIDKGSVVGSTRRSDELGQGTCLVFEVEKVSR